MIKKVAVIGSGVMGSGIAAHITNAGIPVLLLDIVPKDAGEDRNKFAKGAVEKMLKADPAPFMQPKNAKLITDGNIEDNLKDLAEVDWIIEVVLEDLNVKHDLYKKIETVRKKGTFISSNTSTIPLQQLVDGFDKSFREDFLITHFFNPPRYMRLLELVVGKDTRKEAVAEITDFCDRVLGKGVVRCNDTPGFIANRLGVYWMQSAINAAVSQNVSVELADAVLSKPVGVPKTGVFGLIDLVGIDLMPHLAGSMLSTLPKDDDYRRIYQDYPFIEKMIKAGYTGRKGKGGFYRIDPNSGGAKIKQALTLSADQFDENTSYKKAEKPTSKAIDAGKEGLRAVVTAEDEGGTLAWTVLSQTLSYAASLVPEIADDVAAVDEAMRLGYNWKKGPFEMMDDLGPAWFAEKLKSENMPVPALLEKVGSGTFYKIEDGKQHYFGTDGKYHELARAEGVLLLRDIKLRSKPVFKNGSAALWDIGEGVLCIEFTGKMNAIDDQVFAAYEQAIAIIGDGTGDFKALVVYNEASIFSAGVNLGLALFAVNIAMWPQVESLVAAGQQVYKSLKFAPFPVVAAPSGMALGGGCEILLNVDHVQAHAETYCGLVEVGVGVIPGWGGCKEMLLRFMDRERKAYDKQTGGKKLWFSPKNTPMGAVRQAFEVIGTAMVAKSAADAKRIGYFRDTDGITMNRDRLLFDARAKAAELAKDYKAPEMVQDMRLPGATGKMALDMAVADMRKAGRVTPHDVVVSEQLAWILSGGDKADWTKPLSEDDVLALELDAFMKLIREPATLDRIEHMLDKGKPLRN